MAIYRTNFSAPSRPLPKHIHKSGTAPMNLLTQGFASPPKPNPRPSFEAEGVNANDSYEERRHRAPSWSPITPTSSPVAPELPQVEREPSIDASWQSPRYFTSEEAAFTYSPQGIDSPSYSPQSSPPQTPQAPPWSPLTPPQTPQAPPWSPITPVAPTFVPVQLPAFSGTVGPMRLPGIWELGLGRYL